MANDAEIVISFGDVDSGLTEEGFASDFILRSGCGTIFGAQSELSQYQGLDVGDFVRIVRPAL